MFSIVFLVLNSIAPPITIPTITIPTITIPTITIPTITIPTITIPTIIAIILLSYIVISVFFKISKNLTFSQKYLNFLLFFHSYYLTHSIILLYYFRVKLSNT